MATNSSWLIGSIRDFPANTISVTVAGSPSSHTVAAGDYYLYDASTGISLLDAVCTAINAHASIAGVTFRFLDNGKVQLYHASTAFAVTWTDTQVRDLLGFTGNLSSNTSHTANTVSPLFWSPLRTEISDARLGTQGFYVYDTAVSQAGPGRVVATQHNRYRINGFKWSYIDVGRVWDTSESNGTYFKFFDEVLRKYYNFKLYRNVPEGSGSSLTIGSYSALGPYIMQPARGGARMPFRRDFGSVEYTNSVELDCIGAPEYT